MRRYIMKIVGLFMLGSVLVGCGSDEEITNTIIIQEDRQIIGITIEEFDSEHYKGEELQTMLDGEVKAYNTKVGVDSIIAEPVEMLIPEENDEVAIIRAKLHMTYKSAKEYEDFNEVTFFVGTVEEAIEEGFDLDISLVIADEPTTTTKITDIPAEEDITLVITDEKIQVRTTGKIKYYSDDVKVIDKKEISSEQRAEYSYLLFKN